MANIRVDLNGMLADGQEVTFKAPCDCTAIEGIKVYYPKNGEIKNKLFTMKDSHGFDLAGVGNLFTAGSYVHVILDINNGFAYLQNADTNKYLEDRFNNLKPKVVDNLTSTSTDLPLSANQGYVLNNKIVSVEQSFQSGCNIIAGAITSCGINTPANTSPTQMASNIEQIYASRTKLTEIPYASSIDVKKYTSNYASLTADNFIVELETLSYYLYNGNKRDSYSKSYNASTGTLTLNVPYVTSSSSYVNTTVKVWLKE